MQPGTSARPRARWAALVALASGVLLAYSFPQVGIWPFAILSVAGLSWAVDGRRARTGAWLGLLYGLAFFVPLLHWTGTYVGAFPWLLLASAESGFMAALGAALAPVQRHRLAPFWIACLWVLQEFLRDRGPFGGFPWGRLAFSQASSPLRWFAAIGGEPLLTFAVALAGGALFVLAKHVVARDFSWRPVAACVAVLVLLPVLSLVRGAVAPGTSGGGRPLRVALIQGSVPDRGLDSFDRAEQVLVNHVRETMTLAQEVSDGTVPRPDLVVWPENASDVDPFRNQQAYQLIDQTVKAIDAPVLVGAILQGPGPTHRRNAGILWSPTTGPGAEYIKRHPVPFAEYMPLRSIADKLSSAAKLVTQDMVPGHTNGVLRGGPVRLGDVICFEVAYDSLVRSSVSAGAQLLVVQTNNATFGKTSETFQQLAMSRLRAIETGRTVLQVSTTGASAIIRPDGSVVAENDDLFHPAILTAAVTPRTALTLADRVGPAPEYVLSALAFLGVAWTMLTALRRHRAQASTSAPVDGSADRPETLVTTT